MIYQLKDFNYNIWQKFMTESLPTMIAIMIDFKEGLKKTCTDIFSYFHVRICDFKLIQTAASKLLFSSLPVPETGFRLTLWQN